MLFWTLLNIAILLYFLFISVKITVLAKKHLGSFAALVFVIGLLSFMSSSAPDNSTKNSLSVQPSSFVSANGLVQDEQLSTKKIKLEGSYFTKNYLNVHYAKKLDGSFPISTYAGLEGLVNGIKWKTWNIDIKKHKNGNNFEYTVDGILDWKILGMTVYSQLKTYKGNIVLS